VVAARLADGQPAVLRRALGRGQVWLLATSPDPRWSELGTRAGGLLTWLHALVAFSQGPPRSTANWTAGEARRAAFAELGTARQVEVRGPGTTDSRWMQLEEDGAPREPWPTVRPGLYRVVAGERAAVYAVNWPAAEMELAPITAEALRDGLGVPVELTQASEGAGSRSGWRLGPSLSGVLGLLLAMLLIGELVLATRGSQAPPEERARRMSAG
jgi:hypothetical protein